MQTRLSRISATASAIYDLLENKIIPLYYDRDEAGIPQDGSR